MHFLGIKPMTLLLFDKATHLAHVAIIELKKTTTTKKQHLHTQ